MSTKIFPRDGGKTTEEGATRLIKKFLYTSGVLGLTDLQVVQQTVADNTIKVSLGDCVIENSAPAASTYVYHGWITATENVTITANTSGNPRIDYIVAYLDKAVLSTAVDDNTGALKFADVNGTAAGSPSVPSAAQIVTKVGAGNPYIILAQIAVANGFTTIATAQITDLRVQAAMTKLWASVYNTGTTGTVQGTATLVSNSAYTVTKIDPNTAGFGTSDVWKILGGFYFVAPRTGYYEISSITSGIQLTSATPGQVAIFRITQDTSNPTKNNDTTSDTGTTVTGGAGNCTMYASSYLDTNTVPIRPNPVALTAGTTYYFTIQAKWVGAGTASTMSYALAEEGTTLKINEL